METKNTKKPFLNSRLKTIDSHPFIKWAIIPVVLLLFWLAMSLIANPLEGFTVIGKSYTYTGKGSKDLTLYKGQAIRGEFRASENNLGILLFKYKDGRVSHSEMEDYLTFEIGFKDEKPFYSRTAKLDFFRIRESLIFGFPLVTNSSGKQFWFELKSLNGNQQNAITITRSGQFFIAKFKFDKNEVASSFSSITLFIQKKVSGFLHNTENMKATNYFLLPFFFYMIWVLFIRKALFNNKLLPSVVLFIVLVDCFFVASTLEIIAFGVADLWIVTIMRNKYKSNTTFILSGIFLIISVPFTYLGESALVNKLSSWSFIFILIGLIQLLFEERVKKIKSSKAHRLKRTSNV